jgi:hypothetical protein
MSQEVTIAIPKVIVMQTVEGVADSKLLFSINQMGMAITMLHHPQMEVVTVVIMMVKGHLGVGALPGNLVVVEENILPIEVEHTIDNNTMMEIAIHHHHLLLTNHHHQKAQMMTPMIIEIIGWTMLAREALNKLNIYMKSTVNIKN